MKGLPDSAVLGTLGRIKHASNKSKKGSAVGSVFFSNRHSYYYPQRTTQELLELAGHAQNRKKAGK
jgi:hypothetical protein